MYRLLQHGTPLQFYIGTVLQEGRVHGIETRFVRSEGVTQYRLECIRAVFHNGCQAGECDAVQPGLERTQVRCKAAIDEHQPVHRFVIEQPRLQY